MIVTKRLRNRPLIAGWGDEKEKSDERTRASGRLEGLLKSAFNTQLRPLRSLETATKKRRALKKKAAKHSEFTKSSSTASR